MKRLLRSPVKEALDNLPSGVCFFDGKGMVVLCNRQMHRLAFALTGRDLQSLAELKSLLADGKTIFTLDDGSAWQLTTDVIRTEDGTDYTQLIAVDVTELVQRKRELEQDNQRLAEAGARLRRLSGNVTAATREEEILTMKMRVHDDVGRSVIATRLLLQRHEPTTSLDLSAWKNAIRLLKRDSEAAKNKDAYGQLSDAAAGIGVSILLDGTLPENAAAAYLLITAMREAATNAVRHATATELYVKISKTGGMVTAVITNNGTPPAGAITEGGGLSSLRIRIEKAGGRMSIKCTPLFELTVSVPGEGEQ